MAAAAAPEALIDGVTAFPAGGAVPNVLKEELPEERRSRFGAGVAGDAVLPLALCPVRNPRRRRPGQ